MKRPHSFVLVTFLLCYAVLSLRPLEAQPANGQITGLVTDEVTGLPLSGINVAVLDTTGNLITSDLTDNNGVYVNDGLPAGAYFVSTFDSTGFINEVYRLPENRPCTGFCSSTDVRQGTLVEVPDGGGSLVIDFALLASGMITGRITGIAGSSPLERIQVEIRDLNGNVVASAFTNAAGDYAARGGLPTGMYFASTFNVLGFVDEIHANPDDLLCSGFCSAPEVIQRGSRIQVTAPGVTAGIDFALERSGVISGRVIEADTDPVNPLANGNVVILDTEGNIVTVGFTDNTGRYITQGGLPAGTYFVSTDNFAGFRDEVHVGVPCINSCAEEVRQGRGTRIRVNTGQRIANIDFALRRENSNFPPTANAGADQPVLSGAEVRLDGQASRDPEGQSLTYQWEQTDGPPVTLSPNLTVVNPTFQAPAEPGVRLTFSLVVNDGTTPSTPDTVTITVVAACPADGNVDGIDPVTPNDAVLALQYFLNPTVFALNRCQIDHADVNARQGAITPADARCIFQRSLGQPSCLDR